MKAFEFKPKLFTALKNYSKELFMADLMAGIIVGIVALPLAIAFGIHPVYHPRKVLSRQSLPDLLSPCWEVAKYRSVVLQELLSLLFTALSSNTEKRD